MIPVAGEFALDQYVEAIALASNTAARQSFIRTAALIDDAVPLLLAGPAFGCCTIL